LTIKFWLAWYPYDPQTKFPALPKAMTFDDIYLWQYWADGNNLGLQYGVESGSIDLNRSRDERSEAFEDLKQGWGLVVPPDPSGGVKMNDVLDEVIEMVKGMKD
jgi:hypothetical protein